MPVINFKVNFHYSKDVPDIWPFGWYKDALNAELVRGHGRLADYCNPKYEEWNNEFDRLYPDVNSGDEGEGYRFYNSFIRERQLVCTRQMNEEHFSKLMTFDIGPENEIVGVADIPVYGECRIYFTLEPVEE